MGRESPTELTTAFLVRFSDGEFDEAGDPIHPEGPLEGAGDVAILFSILATDVRATLVPKAVPTEITETTLVEAGPTTATVDARVDVAGVSTIDALVELRPADRDETSFGDGRRAGWRVRNVDVGS